MMMHFAWIYVCVASICVCLYMHAYTYASVYLLRLVRGRACLQT